MDGTLFMDTIASVTNLPLRLGNFMRNYTPCIKTAPSRANMKLYVAGQIGTLERKNVENIALESACSSARYPSASAQIWRCSTSTRPRPIMWVQTHSGVGDSRRIDKSTRPVVAEMQR